MKVCFETFGCRLNKAEALQMEADYLARGWQLAKSHAEANLFIVRGCSVTSHAQHECERLITRLKRHHPAASVIVCGCMANRTLSPEKPNTPLSLLRRPAPLSPLATVPRRTARAYLKVQDGCSGRCSFCIVPRFRGEARSEPFDMTLDRARRFVDVGYREIVVTGCNLALYASQGRRLPELVSALAELDGGCRIRVGSVEPGTCADELVSALAGHPNACRFLHLAVQSGSNRTLLQMRRSYAVEDVERTVGLATRLMPGLGLGCDLIVGFPGETETDFLSTRRLIERLPFTNAHVFPFSRRPGTPAARLPNQVMKKDRSSRIEKLSLAIRRKREAFARSFVGRTVEIVVENEDPAKGWTGEYLACETAARLPRKSLARIVVTSAKGDVLRGLPARAQDAAPTPACPSQPEAKA